jgi:AraC-like DNA-binding protein
MRAVCQGRGKRDCRKLTSPIATAEAVALTRYIGAVTGFTCHRPSPPLDAFVELIWRCDREPEPWTQERLLPQGSVELVIDLAAPASLDVVAGPHTKFFVLDTTQRQRLVGVHFKPGGAFPFVRPPMYELRNIEAPLDALWGGLARELRERLEEASSGEAQFAIVEHALVARAGDRLRHHPAVGYALREFTCVPHMRTIADVSQRVGLSQRRFIELFDEQTGLTPKMFCRVRRFQASIQRAHKSARIDWTTLALDCGYFDQAHFIHDFREFSGLTPSEWAARRTEHLNHVPEQGSGNRNQHSGLIQESETMPHS